MSKLERILKDKNVTEKNKIKIAETLVFPIFTFGSESWATRYKDRKKLDGFELWVWRKSLRLSRTERKTKKFCRK